MELFEYFLFHFKLYYNVPDSIQISYGTENYAQVLIEKSPINLFSLTPDEIKAIIGWYSWEGIQIPVIENNAKPEMFTKIDNRIVIHYDIVGLGAYLLSGFQETNETLYDDHGRFKYKESIQYMLGITFKPIVNYYFEILKTAIELLTDTKIESWRLSSKSFTLCLTHDVDNTENAWLEGSLSALKKGKIFIPFKLNFSKWVKQKDKWFNFEEILLLEKIYNVQSTFYFLPRKTIKNGPKNADYNVGHIKFQKVFKSIIDSGSEIGLHGSIGTCSSLNELNQDLANLPAKVKGIRFHFLQFNTNKTLSILEESGLLYDTTLGFAESPGFRNSFCLPFFPYNFTTRAKSKILEIPLVVMDSTLANSNYLGIEQSNSINLITDLINEVQRFNGVMTILWHNTFFSEYKYAGWKNVYKSMLEYSIKQGAQIMTAETIFKRISQK